MQVTTNTAAVGRSIVIRGEVTGAEDLLIDGIVDGKVSLSTGRLTIGPDARVKAGLSAKDIIVQGSVDGDLTATDRVELRKTAVLHGDITASRLSIEEGATVKGNANLTGESGVTRPVERKL